MVARQESWYSGHPNIATFFPTLVNRNLYRSLMAISTIYRYESPQIRKYRRMMLTNYTYYEKQHYVPK